MTDDLEKPADLSKQDGEIRLIRNVLSLKTALVLTIVLAISLLCYLLYFLIPSVTDIKQDNFGLEITRLIADAFLISGIVGFIFESILRRETEAKIIIELNKAIDRFSESTLPKVLISSLIYNKKAIKKLLSDDRVDEVFEWCLESKFDDGNMASELQEHFFRELFKYKERWSDLTHRIILQEANEVIESERSGEFLIFEDTISFRTNLKFTKFKFVCMKEPEDRINGWRQLSEDALLNQKASASIWNMRAAFDPIFEEPYFSIEEYVIENVTLNIATKKNNEGEIEITASNEDLAQYLDKDVFCHYTVRSVLRKQSNGWMLYIPRPVKDLHVYFDIRQTDLKRATINPYFTSIKDPKVSFDNEKNPRYIETHITFWLFPVSGMTFIWQYEEVSTNNKAIEKKKRKDSLKKKDVTQKPLQP